MTTMNITFNCTVSQIEREAITWLAEQGKYAQATVTRRSDREFDLGIEGHYTYMSEERGPSTRLDDGSRPGYEHYQMGAPTGKMIQQRINFGAWFPLACLKVWWGDPKWGLYVDDCGTGDWSFVRDADPETIWGMFDSIVQAARGQRATPVVNKTQGYSLRLH
jgi:hypothetical protein